MPKIQFQPIEHLDDILGLIRDQTEGTREQHAALTHVTAGMLDTPTVERIKRLYAERLELIPVFRKQLVRWRDLPLRPMQTQKIEEAEKLLAEDENLAREILKMAEGFVTIDQILGMSDLDLGMRMLDGTLEPPSPDAERNATHTILCFCGSGRPFLGCCGKERGKSRGPARARQVKDAPQLRPPAEEALIARVCRFVEPKLPAPLYARLADEWAGPNAFEGKAVLRDPRVHEIFLQWIIYDKILPGETEPALRRFAQEHRLAIPEGERAVLDLWLQDRSSIYRVLKVRPGEGCRVADLLRGDEIDVADARISRTAAPEAVFFGRAAPSGTDPTYRFLATLTRIPAAFWPPVEERMNRYWTEYRKARPQASADQFFRAHHARLWREFTELCLTA